MKLDPNQPAYPCTDSMGQVHRGIPLRLEIASRLLQSPDLSPRRYILALGAGSVELAEILRQSLLVADALIEAHNASSGEKI